jgi:hypothetical protein
MHLPRHGDSIIPSSPPAPAHAAHAPGLAGGLPSNRGSRAASRCARDVKAGQPVVLHQRRHRREPAERTKVPVPQRRHGTSSGVLFTQKVGKPQSAQDPGHLHTIVQGCSSLKMKANFSQCVTPAASIPMYVAETIQRRGAQQLVHAPDRRMAQDLRAATAAAAPQKTLSGGGRPDNRQGATSLRHPRRPPLPPAETPSRCVCVCVCVCECVCVHPAYSRPIRNVDTSSTKRFRIMRESQSQSAGIESGG